ncbi:GGDEF domain-containing protein [Ureibacillus sp. MALMAid1270]|uniref:GGDEF domain-containing protein n=1 Tax=Ureibacillus sp. MALMAid1270 TaxID=3411629 RepID=UPI003BA4C5A8
MDIDHFKKVNDTYGHNIGDQVLVHVATVFQTYLDEEVLFARYGGEEFVIALNGQTIAQGEALAKQLGQYLSEQPFNNAEVNINVTVSFGVAERTKDEDETLYQLLNKADNALYSSKGAGRNRVTVYVDTGVEEVFS